MVSLAYVPVLKSSRCGTPESGAPETSISANLGGRLRRGLQDSPLGAPSTIAIVISPGWHEMLIPDSVAASAFAGLPITRQDSRSAIEPAIGLRSTLPIETLLTEPGRSSVTFAPTVWP